MTASSDYGVSIVESFTPPANWIPGQEVNKDVYAVNTGNIAAFVKETVSGVLNYSYETVVDSFDPTCVKLNGTAHTVIDGATTEEAGGFLAWTDAVVDGEKYPTGPVNSARNDDVTDSENDPGVADPQWTPPAAGNYIFRRSIKNGTAAQGSEGEEGYVPATPSTFEYAGYYYDGNGNYYKIILGDETGAATFNPETGNYEFDISANQSALGVTPNADGTLDEAPDIRYVMLKNVENAVPVLTYKEGNIDGVDGDEKYLEAVYSDNAGTQANIEQKLADLNQAKTDLANAEAALYGLDADRARAEVEYQNALAAYNSAKTRYDQTKADFDYADALKTASNKLLDAAKARKEVQDDYEAAAQALNDAATAMKGAADDLSTALDAANTPATYASTSTSIIPAEVRTIIENETAGYGNIDYTYAQSNLQNLDDKWTELQGYYTAMNTALTALKNAKDTTLAPDTPDTFADYMTSADAAANLATVQENLANYKKAAQEYNDLYAAFANTLAESSLSGLVTGGPTTTMTAFLNGANALSDADLKSKVDAYKTAYDAYETMHQTTVPNADTTWAAAVATYNDEVTEAKNNYTAAIDNGNIDLPNWYEVGNAIDPEGFTDNSDTLSAFYYGMTTDAPPAIDQANDGYSLSKDASNRPVIPANTAFKTVYDYLNEDGVEGNYVEVADEDAFVQLTGDPDTANQQSLADLEDAMNDAYNVAYGDGGTVAEPVAGSKKAAYDAAVQAYTDGEQAISDANDALYGVGGTATNPTGGAQAIYDAATTGDPTSTIKILIVLDDDAVDTTNPEDGNWTMVNDQTKAVDFYLNNILEAGETSDKLIDYVMLSPEVTTMDYKDLVFDLNVGLESAQVTYDANQRDYTPEAANSVFAPMTATVGDDNSTVEWADSTPAPTPDPTPTTTPVDVVVDGADAEHNLIKMVKTGTGDTATWAVADSGSTITDADSEHHYTINGAGEYRNVTLGLIPALNAVTGDTTPVVAYVADNPNP